MEELHAEAEDEEETWECDLCGEPGGELTLYDTLIGVVCGPCFQAYQDAQPDHE